MKQTDLNGNPLFSRKSIDKYLETQLLLKVALEV